MKKIKTFICALSAAACGCAMLVGCSPKSDRAVHSADGDAIALLTVYATGERGKVAPLLAAEGHAYCSVKNISEDTITLGRGYELPAGTTVTIASWEFDAHGGIWFNIEPTYIDQGWFVKRKSITRSVDTAALDRMNDYLNDVDNDRWTLFHNCTHFAAELWNAAADGSGDEIDTHGMLTPSNLEKQVKRFVGYEVGRPHESDMPIGYWSDGGFVEFKLVS